MTYDPTSPESMVVDREYDAWKHIACAYGKDSPEATAALDRFMEAEDRRDLRGRSRAYR